MRRIILASLAAVATFANIASPSAQVYPSRPITLVVVTAAGASSDVLARILAERMRASLGQPVIIENVPGAEGSIGVGRVARAPGDGYTLVLAGSSTLVVNPGVMSLPYDVVKDFEPIARVVSTPLVIVTNKAVPANNLQELSTWLKANPGKASQGFAGATSHLAGVFFQNLTGAPFQFVPYRSVPVQLQDLTGGHIALLLTPAGQAVGPVRAGEIKALAVTAQARLAIAPAIPTVDEAGLPGFHFSIWHAIFAPKNTPKPVVARLNAAIVEALADPTVRLRIADLAYEIPPREQQTPEALAAHHKAEIEKWWPIIKEAGIKGE